jgi:hypothetical protein
MSIHCNSLVRLVTWAMMAASVLAGVAFCGAAEDAANIRRRACAAAPWLVDAR